MNITKFRKLAVVLLPLLLLCVAYLRISSVNSYTVVEVLVASTSKDEMIESSDIVITGTIVEIGKTQFNQNNGKLWEDGIPYYDLTINIESDYRMPSHQKELRELPLKVIGYSPHEALHHEAVTVVGENSTRQTDHEHPQPFFQAGDSVVIFARNGELAWKESSRIPAVMIEGGAEQGLFVQNPKTGTFYSSLGEEITLDELNKVVANK